MGEVKETGVLKFDTGKAPMHFIPREAAELMADALGYGAKKYASYNYMKGFNYTRLIDATMRHLYAYAAGEDTDPESGLNHLGHALATLAMLAYTQEHHKDLDDRPPLPEVFIAEKLNNK